MRHLTIFAAVLPLCLLGCADAPRQTKLKPGTTFTIHDVAAQAGPNTKPLTDPDTGVVLNVIDPPLVTEANVASATVTTNEQNSVYLDVELDRPGAAKLQAATAVTGQQVAIVVNGNIASAPIVRAPISGRFRVTGSHTRSDWQKIVQ